MESNKVNASRVPQMSKYYVIARNGQSGGDLTLDSNGDGTIDILIPEGARVVAVEVRGNFTNGSGTSVLKAGSVSDSGNNNLVSSADLETAGGTSNLCWGMVDSSGDGANKVRITVDSATAAPTDGVVYVWIEYVFAPNIVWSQAALA